MDGLSWESLYNPNHTPKDNALLDTTGPFRPYHYSSNVSRENLDIRKVYHDTGTAGKGTTLSRNSLL